MSAPSFATIRLVNRLAVPCVLDAAVANRLGRDFVDALIVLAVVQANVGPLSRDPDLQLAYATYDRPPPDELRRPVSVSAIAHSLRLPYETVRRRIARMAKTGTCEVSAHGVVVPARELASPQHLTAVLVGWDRIRTLYCRVRDLGVLDDVVRPQDRTPPTAGTDGPPMRAVARIASDYLLRVVEAASRDFDGVVAAVIWFSVLRINTEHLPGGEVVAPDAAAPAEVGHRCARAAELARRLDTPQETIRRHAAELVAAGLLARTAKGFVVPAQALVRRAAVKALRSNFADLQRMFAGLAQLGVLAEWDRQNPSIRGAA
ncbi:MAG: ArsR family transcriptional regulator [Phenylobacterium sp.]|nr:MAG: ArsR family transcriptional regulator [Phenylobacterium sp.]